MVEEILEEYKIDFRKGKNQYIHISLNERFWEKVDKKGEDECWNWMGSKISNSGYGMFKYNGKPNLAHRISYILAFGEIPEGIQVCHECDNPSCVNHNHLFLGTQQDNVRDSFDKGRSKREGENHPGHKLNWDIVREIREKYSNGSVTRKDLSEEYNISVSAIEKIIYNNNWKDENYRQINNKAQMSLSDYSMEV